MLILCLAGCEKSALLTVNSLAKFGDYSLSSDLRYGSHSANKLDIYQPERAAKGTIIFFYGGCWGACETLPKEQYRFVGQTLADKGYLVIIPDYRLYPNVLFSEIMHDAVSVVDWVVENGSDFGAQDDRVILMGHSAGAHIGAMLTTNEDYLGEDKHDHLSSFIGLAGPYAFKYDQPYQYKLFSEMTYEQSQPYYFVDGNEPPMLLLYGGDDKKVHVTNINKMRTVLEDYDGQFEARMYDGVNHAQILGALSIPLRERYQVADDITKFLAKIKKHQTYNSTLDELLMSE